MRAPCTKTQADRITFRIVAALVFDLHILQIGGEPDAVAFYTAVDEVEFTYTGGHGAVKRVAVYFKFAGYRERLACWAG